MGYPISRIQIGAIVVWVCGLGLFPFALRADETTMQHACRRALILAGESLDSRDFVYRRFEETLGVVPGRNPFEQNYVNQGRQKILKNHHFNWAVVQASNIWTYSHLATLSLEDIEKIKKIQSEDLKLILWMVGLDFSPQEVQPLHDDQVRFSDLFHLMMMPTAQLGLEQEDLLYLQSHQVETVGDLCYLLWELRAQGYMGVMDHFEARSLRDLSGFSVRRQKRIEGVLESWGLEPDREIELTPLPYSHINPSLLDKKMQRHFFPLHLLGRSFSEISALPIRELGLSTRTERCLVHQYLDENTIGSLASWDAAQLGELRGISQDTVLEITTKLEALGFRLGSAHVLSDIKELSRAQIFGLPIEELGLSRDFEAHLLSIDVQTIGSLYRKKLEHLVGMEHPDSSLFLIELASKLAPVQQRLYELRRVKP